VTRLVLGPRWLAPPIVFVMSPTGARDVLSRNHEWCDRALVHHEIRRLLGDNLADLPNILWRRGNVAYSRSLAVSTSQPSAITCPKPPP